MVAGLKGILPVLPTPFLADGGIDEAGMKRLVVFALDRGVDGVVFPGFASEVETLNAAERATLLKIVVDAVAGRVPVVAGASAADWRDVVEHGRAASALGIRHLMVQPPKSVGTDAPALIEFLGRIVEALPEVEIILQNAPAPRGSDLSPQAIVDIVRALPQVTYVKEETLPAGPAISHIIAHAPSTLKGVIGGGGARYILDEYARGATAAMPALEIAEEHVAIDRALVAGRQEEARRIYVRTLPLLVLQAVYRMRLTKYVLARRGVIEGVGVRAPTPELDAAALADIDANLVELGLLAAEAA
ncbi:MULTISPECIES: dihydrodipicolinate synthase family protein [Agrobacterium]|jgi:4-hydroxy-tetrahydrodipicolinate synthase|uniref:4-hydroxy-tetrahydrodipicolinate synthase n=1 Tax=Agrobacterium tumefaciens TaxID=358 RepID=A0AAW8M149_AGRTU|nr:dihydrodipicolinate synthase family protein [Agrobacterium tumefaciens]MBP2510156.1 4-hydroxy-tetrahydrodipicolinate synthase [Agrobacterium tumefaciens]MBP2519265.1 4-hydroxy-tetrahydrodipicolinate synthase [Agrobacterium tumefaciens]MBP2537016.1 4-hydroxy-tetrahydrodipicolinate synthase [Agrobacterium tumefaciens]MBP2542543.1 4-hydroxy-tetrahydrodipicolinate synthase [Agrobacterium tumefaciens]MBP2568641.1 4-hydroxy-tetrahydrodipicolinate synthase [Agrobacterium tumefaciens]